MKTTNSDAGPPGSGGIDRGPRVSVVIPCCDQAKYLPEAVASVAKQTYTRLEVVIVNDGSPDDTSAVARDLMERYPDLSISLVEQENKGLSAARNAGIAASTGAYWLPLDADDRIAPTFVEKCLRALESLPEAGFAYTDIQHFGDLGTVFRLPPFDAETMAHRNNIGCVCSLVRRKVWKAVGGYDPLMKEGYEDWDFWVGCIEKGWGGVHIADPLFFYRKRGGSMLEDARKKHEALFARIVLNHPSLYGVEKIEAAARTLRERTRQAVGDPHAILPVEEKKRLTVTYLIHSVLGVTGGNQTLVRQANALVDRGHHVYIVTYSETPAWFDFKAKLIPVPAGDAMADHVPSSDVVIATYFLNAPELVSVNAPVRIYFAQGDQYIFGDDSFITDPAARAERERMRQRCAESYALPGIHFVANSYNLAATVHHRYGRMADAILPPCSDQTVFHPLDRPIPPPWRILVVGPDARGSDAEPLTFKGIGDIRRAVDLLAEDGPDFRVVRMSNTTADIFKGYPCEFHFKPADRKKTEIFGKAHIFVYASHYDSRPHPPMEAMAAGAAVVCTATPGALEYCRHEENCLLVPVASPEAIAEAVGRLISDPALYRRLVDGGRATAARYPREREWDALETLLRRLVSQAGAETEPKPDADRIPSADDIHPSPATTTGPKESPMNLHTAFSTDDNGVDAALARVRRDLVENERFDAAVSALEPLLKQDPNSPDVHAELGRVYHFLGETAPAERHLAQAAALAPARADLQRILADFYHVAQGRADAALSIYESLAAANPADPEVGLMAGHLSVGLHRFDRAEAHYRRVVEHRPDHDEAARFLRAVQERIAPSASPVSPADDHHRARELAEAGRFEEAAAILTALVAERPDDAVLHNDLGVVLYQAGGKGRALGHYRQAAELAPESLTFQKNLADFLYVEQGDVAEALKIYIAILEQRPDEVETLLTTGHICVSREQFDDAAHFYRRVLAVEPWHGDARRFLDAVETRRSGTALCDPAPSAQADVQNRDPATADLRRAVADYPDDAQAHGRLGEALHQAGDIEAARRHLETAARLAPDDAGIQKQLADFLYVALGQTEAALDRYAALADAHPADTEIQLLAGHLAVSLGRLDAAEARYRQVMRVEPWHADAGRFLEALARHRAEAAPPAPVDPEEAAPSAPVDPEEAHGRALALAEAGDTQGAAKALESLVASHGDHALAHNDLGVLYGRMSRWDRALAHYRRAVALAPANGLFQKNLADCLAGTQGRHQEALEIYVNLLAADPFDVEALLGTGQVCAALDRPADAEHFYRRALEAEPWNTDARALLDALNSAQTAPAVDAGDLLEQAGQAAADGREDAARRMLERLVKADPNHARACNDLGVLCFRAGRLDEAEEHYGRAAALAPEETLYQKNLADFYAMARGEVQQALEIYVNLLAADPFDVEVLLATGQICAALDRLKDAEHFFERALEAEPWNADARQLLDQLGGGTRAAVCP